MFAWPKSTLAVKASSTSSNIPIWITNCRFERPRPIRVAENVTVTVSVNGGPSVVPTAPVLAPFMLDANLGTQGLTYVWSHREAHPG